MLKRSTFVFALAGLMISGSAMAEDKRISAYGDGFEPVCDVGTITYWCSNINLQHNAMPKATSSAMHKLKEKCSDLGGKLADEIQVQAKLDAMDLDSHCVTYSNGASCSVHINAICSISPTAESRVNDSREQKTPESPYYVVTDVDGHQWRVDSRDNSKVMLPDETPGAASAQ